MASYYNFNNTLITEELKPEPKMLSVNVSDKVNLEIINNMIESQQKAVIKILRNWIKDGSKAPSEGMFDPVIDF